MLNTEALNSTPLNTGAVPPSVVVAPTTSSNIGRPWTLEVRTQAGVLLASLPRWRGGKRKAKANEFETINLSIPGDDESIEHLVFPNEVWLYLGEYETCVSKCTIMTREETRSAGHWVSIECEGLLGQLTRELVTTYETPVSVDPETGDITREQATVKNIVAGLLNAHQTQTPAIRLGKIDASVGDVLVAIRFDNVSILQCLRDLHRICGGYFYVDISRRLCWRRRTGYDAGHWIRFGHNLTQIQVKTDWRQLQTRVIGFGAGGTPATRLQSTANDSAAQAEYGIIRAAVYADTVNEQVTLDAMAAVAVGRRSEPKKTYQVGVVNLAAIDAANYSFEAGMLWVGSRLGIYVDAPEVELTTMVLGIEWDLDNPARVSIELSDPAAIPDSFGTADGSNSAGTKTIFDYIADAIEEDTAKASAGVSMAIARAMSPSTEDITDILTEDNYAAREAEDLAQDYGDDSDVDDFSDAIIARVIDTIEEPSRPEHTALTDAISNVIPELPKLYWLGVVTALPAIPVEEGAYFCKWISTDGGTGDDQMWTATAGQDKWTPMQYPTTLSGTP